jgi:hypothetical protein
MRKESRSARAALVVLLATTAIGHEIPEGSPEAAPALPPIVSALPVEAPTSLFNAKLGKGADDDAQLFVNGSWSASTFASLDLQAESGGGLGVSSAQPFLFSQSPDLSLSFLLYKRVFVEARVAEDLTQARYAVGYRGGEGETLREARIGNDGISFPSLPFLSFGDGSYRSFGASVSIESESFAGKAMVRYDQADRVVKKFVGSTEIVDTNISPNAFITGTYFMTSETPAANLAVYVQSVSGSLGGSDGARYRKLDAGEYSYSAITGVVSLASAASTRVLAYYLDEAGNPHSGGGADAVTVAGKACDLLYVPPPDPATGTLEPKLQLLDRYAVLASPSSAEAFVRNPSSGLRDESFHARIDTAGFVEITRADADTPSPTGADLREAYRRPFESALYADMPWLYTTDFSSDAKTGEAPIYTRSIVVRSFSAASVIAIDKDIVAGSVEVTRDGLPDYSFSVDAERGTLSLVPPPGPTEEIVVSYMRLSAERKSGSLAGALGGFWDRGDRGRAWAALGASWSLPGSSYSSDSRVNPGSINLTAGEKDEKGAFTHSEAIAARYSRDDATGMYRIEGMETTSEYASSFRPVDAATTDYFMAAETAETDLASNFPSLSGSFHSDGSVQKAIKIVAGASAQTARYYKIESTPVYASFKSFAFYAKLPQGAAALTVTLDDGAASPSKSAEIAIPADPARSSSWKRYILHYGKGDATVFVQDDESSDERALGSASSVLPTVTSRGSRLVIAVAGLAAGESAWVDEVILEDSVGRAALLFQGKAAYADPSFALGSGRFPIFSGLAASADAETALDSSPYLTGAASIESTLLFARLGIQGRSVAASDSSPSFSGGHSIELPSSDFPVKAKDAFDFDPSSKAFGRTDSLSMRAGSIASLSLGQSVAWTPAPTVLDRGILLQSWDGKIALGPSIATMGLMATNRSRPARAPSPGNSGASYGSAWLGSFAYALPALESDSESREARATLSINGGESKEYLAASLGESAEPAASGGGLRRDSASLRLAFPFEASRLSIEPYYSRAWKDKRIGSTGGIVQDARSALGDLPSLTSLYGGWPFVELVSAATADEFGSQSAPAGVALAEASLEPEAGVRLSREYGSRLFDLALPSALALSCRRILARADDQVTDSRQWSTTAKFAAIDLFGSMGAYPLGLPFDRDEYLSTLYAMLNEPSGGGAASLAIQYMGQCTLYAGISDTLDAESRLSLAKASASLDWSCSGKLSLSMREKRHWMLDLYSSIARVRGAKAAPEGKPEKASIASLYFKDLSTRTPGVRTTLAVTAGLSGVKSDAADYSQGWSLSESYEAKLTVPERLTFTVDAGSTQSLDRSTRLLSLGFQIGLGAVISF